MAKLTPYRIQLAIRVLYRDFREKLNPYRIRAYLIDQHGYNAPSMDDVLTIVNQINILKGIKVNG